MPLARSKSNIPRHFIEKNLNFCEKVPDSVNDLSVPLMSQGHEIFKTLSNFLQVAATNPSMISVSLGVLADFNRNVKLLPLTLQTSLV